MGSDAISGRERECPDRTVFEDRNSDLLTSSCTLCRASLAGSHPQGLKLHGHIEAQAPWVGCLQWLYNGRHCVVPSSSTCLHTKAPRYSRNLSISSRRCRSTVTKLRRQIYRRFSVFGLQRVYDEGVRGVCDSATQDVWYNHGMLFFCRV